MYVKFNTFDKILIQNEDPNFVYIIKKGKVKVYSLTPTGIKYLERTYCENDLFGELEVFANKPILNYVEALEPCEGIKISKESFLEWIKYDSEFSLYIHTELSEKMYHTSINSKANVAYNLKDRVLFFLWKFLNEHNLNTVHKDILILKAIALWQNKKYPRSPNRLPYSIFPYFSFSDSQKGSCLFLTIFVL